MISIRGQNKIVVDGYVYVKQKTLANNVISYECEQQRGRGRGLSVCKAKIKIGNNMIIVGYVNIHTRMHFMRRTFKYYKSERELSDAPKRRRKLRSKSWDRNCSN